MMKYIPLTQGRRAFVDNEDFERVNAHKWFYRSNKYAARGWIAGFRDPDKPHAKTNQIVKIVYMHRFILDVPDGMEVDHVNGNGLDNRRANLRLCTHQQNIWNSKAPKKTRKGRWSRYKGVGYLRQKNRKSRWRAYYTVNKRSIYLGHFKTAIEAARAHDNAVVQSRGEFARLNFPIVDKTTLQ